MPIPVSCSLAALIDSTEPHLVRVLLSCDSVSRVTSNAYLLHCTWYSSTLELVNLNYCQYCQIAPFTAYKGDNWFSA